MNKGITTIIYPVRDAAKAKAIYTRLLGVEPFVDAPYYIGYKVGDQDIGLDPNGHAQGLTGPLAYHEVDDIQKVLQSLLDAGATAFQEIKDVGGGKLVASVKDADGNVIGLMQTP